MIASAPAQYFVFFLYFVFLYFVFLHFVFVFVFLNFQGDSLRTGPPSFPHLNGHLNGPSINMIDVDNKKSAVDVSNELSRRVMELGKERSLEPETSMGHLQVETSNSF